MRIVSKPVEDALQAAGRAAKTKKSVQFGKEDILFFIVIAVILIGGASGQLTIQEVLTYLGVSGAGGVWGFIGGKAST